MSSRRLLVLLAPLGTLAGHAVSYRSSAPDDGWHGYLGPVSVVLVALGVAGLGWLVVSRRGAALALPRARSLAVAQVALFAAQEVTERLVAGGTLGDLAANSAVRWGIGVQVLVAAMTLFALRILRHLWSAAAGWGPLPWLLLAPVPMAQPLVVALRPALVPTAPSRGPPVVA